jgi:hypothetical protein
LVLVLSLPVAWLALGGPIPWLAQGPGVARVEDVPPGDREMAWIHTTTAGNTWERFVSGVKRAELTVPGLHVDDSQAFLDVTTSTPEVVLRRDGHAGKLRIRWYKLTSEATAADWVKALAERDPAPLALIGGGSSDRALDLARALDRQTTWLGDRPLLLITTATADVLDTDPNDPTSGAPAGQRPQLIDVYNGRSFRFCFTNRQMAEAVIDFVLQDPGLRPGPVVWPGLRAAPTGAAGPWAGLAALGDLWAAPEPVVFSLAWRDDPYSIDLCNQFKECLYQRLTGPDCDSGPVRPFPRFFHQGIEFSVGSFYRPNRHEAAAADSILANLPPRGQRSLLVIPTVAPPARRVLRTLADGVPVPGRRLVAITGDGISVNTIYRDGAFAWPVRMLPVPLVMFTHNDPFGWDAAGSPVPPPGYELHPPTSTEDVLHFAELARQVAEAVFVPPTAARRFEARDGLLTRADHLAARLRERTPAFFDAEGNRLGGSGEYVVVLRPTLPVRGGGPRPAEDAVIDAYRRGEGGKGWVKTRSLPVVQGPRADGRDAE